MIAYIGAGRDIYYPPKIFKDQIIFVDSQPFSEFGNTRFIKGFYRKRFADFIDNEKIFEKVLRLSRPGLCCNKQRYIHPHAITLSNGCKYYISSAFPQRLSKELIQDLRKCNKVILCGHIPSLEILKYLQQPITYYLNITHTCFNDPSGSIWKKWFEREGNSLLKFLWTTKDPQKIISYTNNGEFHEFDNIKDCWDCMRPAYS